LGEPTIDDWLAILNVEAVKEKINSIIGFNIIDTHYGAYRVADLIRWKAA
jgi:hypothetical protein